MNAPVPHRIAAALLALLALAACQREAAPPVDPAAADPAADPAAAPAAEAAGTQPTLPGTDAVAVVDEGPLDPDAQTVGGLHVREFAGVFSTEGARIELRPDGTYAMTVHAASADADLDSAGTWTPQAGGREILLDPDDKSEPDRRYTVVSKDEIRQANGGQVLRREGAG